MDDGTDAQRSARGMGQSSPVGRFLFTAMVAEAERRVQQSACNVTLGKDDPLLCQVRNIARRHRADWTLRATQGRNSRGATATRTEEDICTAEDKAGNLTTNAMTAMNSLNQRLGSSIWHRTAPPVKSHWAR